MTKLSVIIVNYNVKYFLEQALLSVQKAAAQVQGEVEVFVVDNNSKDASVEMVQEKFDWVKLIANKTNTGFATANNQAIKQSIGEYLLLLNPDTVIEEDTFSKIIQFMDANAQAGALGVKMIDGAGNFLPESKRGLPTPMVAFYKVFGLSSLFPKSKRFNKYHLGYLSPEETNEVEVLSGAFMLLRKSVIDEIGGLDETFFMYGEDIDLSYRVLQAGYKNYYFPETTIIHYKGESTKKGSLNYVKMFYNAMSIFAKKHYSGGSASIFNFFIQIAIIIRGIMTVFGNLARSLWLPLVDAGIIFLGIILIKNFWENSIKAGEGLSFPTSLLWINIPLYIIIWVLSSYFSGGYDKPLKIPKHIRGLLFGTILISAVYGFLPETLRFSRAMILLGGIWAILTTVSFRYILHFLMPESIELYNKEVKKIAIAGSEIEAKRVLALLNQVGIKYNYVGLVSPTNNPKYDKQALGDLGGFEQLKEIVSIYKLDEIIFCSKDISSNAIIDFMTSLGKKMSYRIVPEESSSIVGSNSKNSAGDLYAIDVSLNIATTEQKRNKRLLDLAVCTITAILSPVLIFLLKTPTQFLKNWWQVFTGKWTWVGYARGITVDLQRNLPVLKNGVLSPIENATNEKLPEQTVYRLNFIYAKEYTTRSDIQILRKNWRQLGKLVA